MSDVWILTDREDNTFKGVFASKAVAIAWLTDTKNFWQPTKITVEDVNTQLSYVHYQRLSGWTDMYRLHCETIIEKVREA